MFQRSGYQPKDGPPKDSPRPSPPGPRASLVDRTFNERTPAGRALALVYELRSEKKISSADQDALMAVLEPVAFAECAAMDADVNG
jgi:hypothetical protein